MCSSDLTLLIVVVLLLPLFRYAKSATALLAAIFLVICIAQIHAIVQSHVLHNTIEQHEARTIVDEIEDYEVKNGVQIKRVGIVLDAEPTWTYPEVTFKYHDLNARAITRSWSDVALLRYVAGRVFERIEVSAAKRDELRAGNPNRLEFDADDDVSFEGDTAYIVVY